MTFRDDADALLARNDALERENAELRERCERLEAELAEARKPPAKPAKRPRPARPSSASGPSDTTKMLQLAAGVGLAILLIGTVCVIERASGPDDGPTSPPPPPADAGVWYSESARWQGLHALLHCRRNQINRLGSEVLGDTVYDPRGDDRNHGEWINNLTSTGCENDLKAAARDPWLPAPAVAAIDGWYQAERQLETVSKELGLYYLHRDFVDDDLAKARARWPELRAAVVAHQAALVEVERAAVGPIRDDVIATVAGRDDDAHWRTHLHLAIYDLGELLYRQPPDPAQIAAAATRVRELAGKASVEVRRRIRPLLEALAADTADAESLRTPVFRALYDVTPGSHPAAELR